MSKLSFELARLGFLDGERAEELLAALSLTEEQVARLADVADPDQALDSLMGLVDHGAQKFNDVELFSNLVSVLGSSRALGEFLNRHPEFLNDLSSEQLNRPFDDVLDWVQQTTTPEKLVIAYRRGLLRIAWCDVRGGFAFSRVAQMLADLAGAALEKAHDLACADVADADQVRLAVMAMGKTGGRELNYISDVDVIFVAEPSSDIAPDQAIKIATKVASRLMRICAEHGSEGSLWEVDANLRPEGASGALVRTVAAHAQYYERWAETWEFQALLKARFIAGDASIAQQYSQAILPKVWQASAREDFVGQVRRMRKRVIDHIPDGDIDFELKLGPGGLRDVEFAVQLLQLVHGRVDESLRSPTTLSALAALIEGGYVGREDGAALIDAYSFLRVLENRIQLFDLRRTHLMPTDERSLRRLARGMGFRTGDELVNQWQQHRLIVRKLHEKIFYRPLLEAVASLPTEGIRLTSEAAQDRLSALGYRDPRGALIHLESLTAGLSRRASIQKALLPAMLQWFSESPNPDAGLLAFRKISEELGETHWYLRKLRDEGEGARHLATVLSSSSYVSDLIIRAPDSVAILGDNEELIPRSLDQLHSEMQAAVTRHTGPAAIAAIRRSRRRELARIAIADSLGRLEIDQVGQALTDLTIATLDAALRAIIKDFETKRGAELPMAMAIVLMGRVGGYETGYGSDADVMFVYSSRGDDAAAHSAAMDVAVELRKQLAQAGPDPALEIDADLRPEGRNGPLVRSLKGYASYYERWSAVWEAQALLRANPIVGDKEVCAEFLELINPLRWPPAGISETEVKEIKRIKARIDTERLPKGADPATHLKLGRGGLADIEWTVQLVQMRYAHTHESLRTTRTLQALDAARELNLISEEDHEALSSSWRFVSRIRDAIMLLRGRPSDSMVQNPDEQAGLAHLLGYGADQGQALVDEYLRLTRRARKSVEKIFYG